MGSGKTADKAHRPLCDPLLILRVRRPQGAGLLVTPSLQVLAQLGSLKPPGSLRVGAGDGVMAPPRRGGCRDCAGGGWCPRPWSGRGSAEGWKHATAAQAAPLSCVSGPLCTWALLWVLQAPPPPSPGLRSPQPQPRPLLQTPGPPSQEENRAAEQSLRGHSEPRRVIHWWLLLGAS